MNYEVEKSRREIGVEEYVEKFVNVAEFLEYCKACPNYGRVWSCPPYDFEAESVWRQYRSFYVVARKINFAAGQAPADKAEAAAVKTPAGKAELAAVLAEVKDDMSRELYELEKTIPGSLALSAGSCNLCRRAAGADDGAGAKTADAGADDADGAKTADAGADDAGNAFASLSCARAEGLPCRYPEKMRYSIESLGGNVGLTVSKLMGIELEWMEEGKMPSYFVLVGGLLKK